MFSKERNIVLLGQTGSGKSTFINYLVNCFHGGSVSDLKVAIPTRFHKVNMPFKSHEKALNDGSKSKTAGCHRYSFNLTEDVKFHFIDTPGINDTNGLIQDNKNIEQIFSYIQEMDSLTAVIFIINDSQRRLTPASQYVFERLESQIPQSVYNNMLIIRTNWSGYTKAFRPKDFGLPENCSMFCMQNSAYASNPHDLHSTEIIQLQTSFDESMKTLNQIIKYILQLTPISIQAFKDMYAERNTIKTLMHQSKIIFCQLQELEEKIALWEDTAKIHEQNGIKFEEHIQTMYVTQYVPTETPYHNTLCEACNYVCHEDCRLNETEKTGDQIFFNCSSISNRYCTKCPKHCAYTRHYHSRTIFIPVLKPISNVIEAFQERYKAAHIGKEEAMQQINSIQIAKNAIQHELRFQYCHIKESVKKLQEHCPNVNVVSELMQMIDDLRNESNKLKSDSSAYMTNKFIQKLKELCDYTSAKVIVDEKLSSGCQENSTQSPNKLFNTDSQHLTHSISVKHEKQNGDSNTVLSPSNMTSISIPLNEEAKNEKSANSVSEKCYETSGSEQPDVMTHIKEEYADKTTDTDDNILHSLSDKAVSCSDLYVSTDITPTYAEYSTNRLLQISQHLAYGKKSSTYLEIEHELQCRCEGKSIGYLNSDQQFILCEQFKILSSGDTQNFFRLYINVKESITKYTQGNVMKINDVPFELLCRITAIYMILYGRSNDCDN